MENYVSAPVYFVLPLDFHADALGMQVFESNELGNSSFSEREPISDIIVEDSADVPGHRGDEGLLEGVVIKETDEVAIESDDDDDGIIIFASRNQGASIKRPGYDKGSRSYVRPQQFAALASSRTTAATAPEQLTAAEAAARKVLNEELKKLRFSGSRTAFDVDIDALEEHPWRLKGADISDYFNYGFDEKTWMNYCEGQLRLRAKMGQGPVQHPVLIRPTIASMTVPLPGISDTTEATSVSTYAIPLGTSVQNPAFQTVSGSGPPRPAQPPSSSLPPPPPPGAPPPPPPPSGTAVTANAMTYPGPPIIAGPGQGPIPPMPGGGFGQFPGRGPPQPQFPYQFPGFPHMGGINEGFAGGNFMNMSQPSRPWMPPGGSGDLNHFGGQRSWDDRRDNRDSRDRDRVGREGYNGQQHRTDRTDSRDRNDRHRGGRETEPFDRSRELNKSGRDKERDDGGQETRDRRREGGSANGTVDDRDQKSNDRDKDKQRNRNGPDSGHRGDSRDHGRESNTRDRDRFRERDGVESNSSNTNSRNRERDRDYDRDNLKDKSRERRDTDGDRDADRDREKGSLDVSSDRKRRK